MLRPYKAMYSVAELRAGQAIELDGSPFLILSATFSRKSQGKANCVTKIRNLKTGAVTSKTFSGADKVERAIIGYKHVQYLFASGGAFTFMDLGSFDQFELSEEIVGEGNQYFVEGMELDVLTYDEKPIAVKLPITVELKITETTPGLKGDTAQGGSKPATLESGLTVNVPLFVNEGDTIKVNTERGEYVERV
jgi:elongation factor P